MSLNERASLDNQLGVPNSAVIFGVAAPKLPMNVVILLNAGTPVADRFKICTIRGCLNISELAGCSRMQCKSRHTAASINSAVLATITFARNTYGRDPPSGFAMLR